MTTTASTPIGRAGENPTTPSAAAEDPSVRPSAHDTWLTCVVCGMEVRADRLDRHRATQH